MEKPSSERLVFQDDAAKLFLVDGHAQLNYNGKVYHFGCQPFEPMAIIYCGDVEMAYIHNSFDVDISCKSLLQGELVHTITGRDHNAEQFCHLLTTAIDSGFPKEFDKEFDAFSVDVTFLATSSEWDIGELERKASLLYRREHADVLFRDDNIELLFWGSKEEMINDDNHFFLNVDGKEYDLWQSDDVWCISLAGQRGKSSIVARIHQVGKALLAAHPYTYATLCQVLAFALRGGKKDYNLREIEKQI